MSSVRIYALLEEYRSKSHLLVRTSGNRFVASRVIMVARAEARLRQSLRGFERVRVKVEEILRVAGKMIRGEKRHRESKEKWLR
jgi:hypothetical protein